MGQVSQIADTNIDSQVRESGAIFNLFCINSMPALIAKYYSLSLTNYIVGINIPFHSIMSEEEFNSHNFVDSNNKKITNGDIDVCLIPLKGNLSYGANSITPDFERIIAIEVKVMGFDKNGKVMFKKRKRKSDREQADKLTTLGLNDVGLLYIVATEPPDVPFKDFDNWWYALDRATLASDKLNNFYTTEEDKFSTFALFIGAIHGEIESYSNSSTHRIFKRVEPNFLTDRTNPFRIAFETRVGDLFPYKIEHNMFPVQIRGCFSCKKLALFSQEQKETCPYCYERYR